MTIPQTVSHNPRTVPWRVRVRVRLASAGAALLARCSVNRIHRTLLRLRSGAAPATSEQAVSMREAVMRVSLPCARPDGCLRRSVAVVLLARMYGSWATWCTGPTTRPPFMAHAWIEAEGRMVGEPVPEDQFCAVIRVRPDPASERREDSEW